jgi:protoheme IX farnesyltransferase
MTTITPHWPDYLALCKPRAVALIVFTAVIGMCLATPGVVPWNALLFGTLGIGLAAASAAAINHVVDRRVDAIMARTQARPLPAGHLQTTHALGLATVLGTASMAVLVLLVNPLTALLTLLTAFTYAVVYTTFLKRATPQNIVLGGVAGAAPPVLGWAAVTGHVDPQALLLFLIIFVWTPPHFWALAICYRHEYAQAEIPMLPVTHGLALTRRYILLYTLILVPVTLLPFATGMSGPLYLCGALGLGGGFIYRAIALQNTADDRAARRTFAYSILYLAALFSALLADHYLALLRPPSP